MKVAFKLSMPGCNSWNGKWSGDGKCYAIVKSFATKKAVAKIEALLKEGNYWSYDFGDGWRAGVSASVVSDAEARKLKRMSKGFGGYDWMIEEILDQGFITPVEVRYPTKAQMEANAK